MMTLASLHQFGASSIDVTVVQPSPYHYYSGMGPGMLGATYEPEQIRFDTRRQVERGGGTFIENTAVHIDPIRSSVTLADGSTLSYDALSCNTGSQVAADIRGNRDEIIPAKPIAGLIAARKRLIELIGRGAVHVGIVGGGPSAVELACNVRQLADRHDSSQVRITLFAGHRIFPGRPPRLQRIVKRYLAKRQITGIEESRIVSVSGGAVKTDRKQHHSCDLIFTATGVAPAPMLRQSGLSTEQGSGLAVNRYLQSITYENIFGGGDCIDFVSSPLDKVGVYAVRQNPVLLHNLLAFLNGRPLRPFSPGGGYLLVYNMGKGHGILAKGALIFSGRLAFVIKDYIDRRFMRAYRC
jgi:NADH dehydrogenase FAD-containing subunit